MRSIHVLPGLSEEASGPSYSVVRLCETLLSEGVRLTLATMDWNQVADTPSFIKKFPIGSGPKRLGRSPAMYKWLRNQCARSEIDILHCHGMWQMNAIYPAWVARHGCVPLVSSPRGALSNWARQHGSQVKRVFWPLLQLPALKQTTCFHATSEQEFQDIRRIGFRQPVAVIPNGIDLPPIPARIPDRERTLLFLGRIHVVKGLDILLSAWRAVQDEFPEWRLIIAGSDTGYHGSNGYLDDIKRQASDMGLERIEFAGALYGGDKLRAYRDADLYVLPSRSENFAVTVAESLAMATPVIVSKGAPWSGVIQNDAGWWVDVGVDPLATCLKEALSRKPQELSSMGQRGRSWMKREFSWSRISRQMIETYGWLCDRAKPVPPCVRLD